MMKNHFNKELIETKTEKEIMRILRTVLNVGFVITFILMMMLNVKVRGHCHNTGKYRDSTN